MSGSEASDPGEAMTSDSSNSTNCADDVEDQETEQANNEGHGIGNLSSLEDSGDISRTDQLRQVVPKIDAPATPSNRNDVAETSSNQNSQTSGSTPGVGPTPIQPYIPYYPAVMPGFPALPQTDVRLVSTNSNTHQYVDVSNLSDPIPDTRRNRGGVTEPFPEKLHRMLEQTERDGLSDIVSFFSHGRAFAIHKPKRFQSEIMPIYFKQTRLTSFQRQLNLYGFRRISQGPDNGGYYHELFLKGRPGLCVNLKRTKVKGSHKIKRDPDTEPNFYSYPPIRPQVATMMPTPAMIPPHMQHVPHGQQIPTSPPSIVYPGYAYPPASFQGYPTQSMQQLGPYTAAQQPVPSSQGPPMYGYSAYYPYPTWYQMPTTLTSPMPARGTKSDDSSRSREQTGCNDPDGAGNSMTT